MKYNINFLKDHKILIFILFIACVLRFYNFSQRWALAYDQAWFAVIARHAIDTFQIPLLGPFASGGPFQTGGEWFWIVMAGILINPFSVISPWVFIAILSVFQVFLLYILGREFINKKFGYLIALTGVVSTSQTLQATNLTSQMTTSIMATFLLYFMIRYIKTKRGLFLFTQGLTVGIATSIHLSGVLLIIPLLLSIIFTKSFKFKKLLLILTGLLIPWVPVLLIDFQNGFYNTRNIILYFVHPQGSVSYDELGRRWLTYIGIFWPTSWSRIFGGFALFGYLQIILLSALFVRGLLTKSIKKEWFVVACSTVILVFVIRYLKTPLFENYLTFMHPLIFLLIGFTFWNFYKLAKWASLIIFIILIIGSITATYKDVSKSTNFTATNTQNFIKILKSRFPDEKFAIYDYKYKTGHSSLPLVYYLQTERLLDNNGRQVGVFYATPGGQMKFDEKSSIAGNLGVVQLIDLSSSTSSELEKTDWAPVNPSFIYDSVQNWYKK